MCKDSTRRCCLFIFSMYVLDFSIFAEKVFLYVIMQNEVIRVKKMNEIVGKIVFNTAVKTAELAVNSACWTIFYQEKLDSQTDVLKKYHDKKNS